MAVVASRCVSTSEHFNVVHHTWLTWGVMLVCCIAWGVGWYFCCNIHPILMCLSCAIRWRAIFMPRVDLKTVGLLENKRRGKKCSVLLVQLKKSTLGLCRRIWVQPNSDVLNIDLLFSHNLCHVNWWALDCQGLSARGMGSLKIPFFKGSLLYGSTSF